jgi:hydrogenase maturation protease
MDVEPDSIEGSIDDDVQIDPHGMNPETVLRFVKATGGWPGKVVVIACEPAQVEVAIGLSEPVAAAVEGAVQLVVETIEELRARAFAG